MFLVQTKFKNNVYLLFCLGSKKSYFKTSAKAEILFMTEMVKINMNPIYNQYC